jgi:uncharacterized membrane protein
MARLNGERMRYQNNIASFWLCILSILFNVVCIFLINENRKIMPDYYIGIDIVYNIVFMILGFMGAEKSKTYNKSWSYILAIMGAIQVLRIFIVPLRFYLFGQLKIIIFLLIFMFYSLSGLVLIISAILCYTRSTILREYLKYLILQGED